MILIGQYDSPYVRRVAITMRLYDLHYEHRPWSVFGDGDKLATYNPLRRVPTLLVNDELVLIETFAIIDFLDERVGRDRAMIAENGNAQRDALKVCALASGLADKAVSLVYERVLHETTSPDWVARCEQQIGDVLDALELDRGARSTSYWFGNDIGHADIAVACAMRFVTEAHPALMAATPHRALAAHAERCEALPAFQEIVQPLAVPK